MTTQYMDKWKNLFLVHRPYLISFAFRMTGSLAEAEDIVQDTYLVCLKINPDEIQNHKSWLTKVCSNKGLDHLKSAYKKRQEYYGPWLPDSIPDIYNMWQTETEVPSHEKTLLFTESITTTFLLLIERLSPEERAVYLLSEIFDYSFKEIAEFLAKTEATCRKIAQRARESVLEHRPKFETPSPTSVQLIQKFFEAAKLGDVESMMNLLDDSSEFWSDGGGKVSAANRVLLNKKEISKFFKLVGAAPAFHEAQYKIETALVNSMQGLVVSKMVAPDVWTFETIFSFEFLNGKIARIYAQRNPDKLAYLKPHALN